MLAKLTNEWFVLLLTFNSPFGKLSKVFKCHLHPVTQIFFSAQNWRTVDNAKLFQFQIIAKAQDTNLIKII